ncbi:MAG: hypothetical protein AAAB20_01855 [Rhizobium sp.]|jgi:putative transposase|uniref:hypothetical protein n=1 Tax=Rhizobium sp. TaxID=391 RepID=UPI00055CA9A7
MADEITASGPNDTTLGNPTIEKKTRAPRKSKTVAEAAVSPSVSAAVKKTRGRRKNTEESTVPSSAAPVSAKKGAPAKSSAKAQPAKRGPRKVEAAKLSSDSFADLLKLEEENQKLRKALSDKLRAENVDLRKKLGLA